MNTTKTARRVVISIVGEVEIVSEFVNGGTQLVGWSPDLTGTETKRDYNVVSEDLRLATTIRPQAVVRQLDECQALRRRPACV